MEFSKDPNLKELVSRFLEHGRNQKISILVVGRTGASKSQIINSLIGWPVAKEGHTLEAQSMHVQCHKMKINDVEVFIWDSPGLGDVTANSDEDYLDQMKEVGKVDLVLFCANMNIKRVDQADLNCITKLTQYFGAELWKNAMIVFTFANEVRPPPGSPRKSLEDHFRACKLMFKETYYKTLRQVGVAVDELILHQQLPVVTAGHLFERSLPDTDDWIQNLWMQAFKNVHHSCKPAFLCANAKRLFAASRVAEHSRVERGEYFPHDETWDSGKFSPVLQNSRGPHSVCPTHRQPSISGAMAAKMENFQNLVSEPTPRSSDRIPRRHTMCVTQGYQSDRNQVQSLAACFEQKMSLDALEPQMRRSASLHRPRRKQGAASSSHKGPFCDSEEDFRIGVSAENEKGILDVITRYFLQALESVKYAQTGAQAGKLIGEVFSTSLGAERGKTLGFITGELVYLIKSNLFTNEKAGTQKKH